MNSTFLFKMGNKDYTRFIKMASYKVNSFPVTKDYSDINQVKHSQYVRDQVKGSFTLTFFDDMSYPDVATNLSGAENYQQFFNEYQRLREYNGRIEITVYINNLNVVKTIYADMEMEPVDTMPYMNSGKSFDGFDVTITER